MAIHILPLDQEPQLDLEACGLPENYYRGGGGIHRSAPGCKCTRCWKRAQRLKVLTGWFDRSRPNVLCTDIEAFVKAQRLWVEWYYKPDEWTGPSYYFNDPAHKSRMVRSMVSPPTFEKEPSKTIMHAPRGTAKSFTCVFETVPMIAICRPRTVIGLSRATKPTTRKHMKKIRQIVQKNMRIQADFGGAGQLYPSNRDSLDGDSWSADELTFISSYSTIHGVSVGESMRGDRYDLGVVDDPEAMEEKEKKGCSPDEIVDWLFHVYLDVFMPGGVALWITTNSNQNSAAYRAFRGVLGTDEERGERDRRFDDWNRVIIPPIYTDPNTGEEKSIMPEKWDIDDIEIRRQTRGESAVSGELFGDPIPEGEKCLQRDPVRHGWIDAIDKTGRYAFDMLTGERWPWAEFLADMRIVTAVDLADSTSPGSDPGAIVTVGQRGRTLFLLDVFMAHINSDALTERAFIQAETWGAWKIVFETDAMQCVCVRSAKREREKRMEEGRTAPFVCGISSEKRKKLIRIASTLIPVFAHEEIRIPFRVAYMDSSGVTHKIMRRNATKHIPQLCKAIDTFTDKGCGTWIDPLDALEMAVRTLGGHWGTPVPTHNSDAEQEDRIERMVEAGVIQNPYELPEEAWTDRMRKEFAEQEVPIAIGSAFDTDPYAYY